LIGCATTAPKWYYKSYLDPNYIYAKGEGNNKEEAIKSALSNLASQIEVKISSNFESYKSYSNDKNIRFLQKRVSAKSLIDIYNYEIVKEAKGDKFYVLVRINKKRSADAIYDKSLVALNEIEKIDDKVKLWEIRADKKLENIIRDLKVALLLDNNPKIYDLLQRAIADKKRVSFGFDVRCKEFEDLFKIDKRGIKVICKKRVKKDKIARYYLVEIDLKLIFKDKTKKVCSLKCAAKSVVDFKSAYEFAIKECKEAIRSECGI
jgi:hypothetical protein